MNKYGMWALGFTASLGMTACDSKSAQSANPSKPAVQANGADSHDEHHHVHKAPRGGALVEMGEEFAHLEVLADPKVGRIDLYLLDAHGENALRSKQRELELTFTVTKYDSEKPLPGKPMTLTLIGVVSELAGETAGDTSHFTGKDDALVGATKFDAVVKLVEAKGQEFRAVKFTYPAGNE